MFNNDRRVCKCRKLTKNADFYQNNFRTKKAVITGVPNALELRYNLFITKFRPIKTSEFSLWYRLLRYGTFFSHFAQRVTSRGGSRYNLKM